MSAIDQLTREEKLRMMECLWKDLSRDEHAFVSPSWHAGALREAELALADGETEFIDWEQAKKLLLGGDGN